MNFLEHVPNGNSDKKQWGRGGYPTLFTGRDFYITLELPDRGLRLKESESFL